MQTKHQKKYYIKNDFSQRLFPNLGPHDNRTSKMNLKKQDSKSQLLISFSPAWGLRLMKKTSSGSTWGSTVNEHKINSLQMSTTIQWGSILNWTTPLFQRNSSIQINEKSSSKHTITPCQQDGKLSPNIFNNHVFVNKKIHQKNQKIVIVK